MPALPSIPVEELAAIRRSVMEAARLCGMGKAEARPWRKALRDKSYTKERLDADMLLYRFRYSPRQKLNAPAVRSVITASAERDDKRFFIRLGKVLARKPGRRKTARSFREVQFQIPPLLLQFLMGHWADDSDDLPALCRFTPEGVLVVLQHQFGRDEVAMDVDGIVKLRQRLGLRPLRRPKVHVLLVGDGLRYVD
jgi:hypothetical protein